MYVFFMCLFKRMQILVATASVVFLISSCSFKLTPKAKVSGSSFDSRTAANSNPVPSCPPEDMGCDNVCYSGVTNDCDGICNGSAEVGCDGVCNSGKEYDCNQICGGTGVLDCDGTCNGPAEPDCAGNCNGGAKIDCRGDCNFPADDFDRCGVCGGNGSTCAGPLTIPLKVADCGNISTYQIGPDGRPVGEMRIIGWVAPTNEVCCPYGVKQDTVRPYLTGASTTINECCARSVLNYGFGSLTLGLTYYSNPFNQRLSNVITEAKYDVFGNVVSEPPPYNQNWLCCATTPSIKTAGDVMTSVKLIPPESGTESSSLTDWNGNLHSYQSPYVGKACLPPLDKSTQNQFIKGSADSRYPGKPIYYTGQVVSGLENKPLLNCRGICNSTNGIEFFPVLGYTTDKEWNSFGSTCTPTSGVNGNEKGVCLPCPECEYKKQLPSVLTPCTHDQLLAERSQGKVPLCEKEPEVCAVPQ